MAEELKIADFRFEEDAAANVDVYIPTQGGNMLYERDEMLEHLHERIAQMEAVSLFRLLDTAQKILNLQVAYGQPEVLRAFLSIPGAGESQINQSETDFERARR